MTFAKSLFLIAVNPKTPEKPLQERPDLQIVPERPGDEEGAEQAYDREKILQWLKRQRPKPLKPFPPGPEGTL
jgi:hypothetical protein